MNNEEKGSIKVDFVVHTAGKGYWTRAKKEVRVKKIKWYTQENQYAINGSEIFLEVYPDKRTWTNRRDGLIYTDTLFLKELREQLIKMEKFEELPVLPWEKVDYTEQGMQGKDYVNLILVTW